MSSFDSYIDRLVDRSFRKLADGTLVYLPWGRGRGYLITSDETHQRLREFTRSVTRVGFLAVFIIGPSVWFLPWRIALPVLVLFGLGYLAAFTIGIRRLAGDLPRTGEYFRPEALTPKQRMRLGASETVRLYGVTRSRVILVGFALFALMCVLGVFLVPEKRLGFVGAGLICGAGALWTRYGLRVMREEDEAERSKRPPGI